MAKTGPFTNPKPKKGQLARPCTWPGCPSFAKRKGRCEVHQRIVERERGSAAKRGYNSARWHKLRKLVLHRDPICKKCGLKPSTDADHVIPKDKGGSDSMDNLQGLCASCHAKKTRAENATKHD